MRIHNNNIFINKFKDFDKIKNELIADIKATPGAPLYEVSKTDWLDGRSNNQHTAYWKKVLPAILESYHYIKTEIYGEHERHVAIDFGNVWYQIYEQGSFHSYHTHPGCNFSNVLYVNLPNTSTKTQFINIPEIEVEEGDIVTFPAHLLHCSPVNKFTEEKIVIAFNTSLNCDTRFDIN